MPRLYSQGINNNSATPRRIHRIHRVHACDHGNSMSMTDEPHHSCQTWQLPAEFETERSNVNMNPNLRT